MSTSFDPTSLTMTEIIRLQTVLSQELARRFERKAALAFTDIVDSTQYFSTFGDETGRRLQQLHLDLVERCTAAHEGRIVDTAGDGAFACFPSATAAARAMVALQNQVSAANVSQPQEHQLRLRIGLHWGTVLSDGVQVTGDSVNFCARVVASAQPGEIRLSRELFQELAPDLRGRARALDAVQLKGYARSVELMALTWRDPARFPSQVLVRETGECFDLPPFDTVRFGRGETPEDVPPNDILLVLSDPKARKQISRRHFELVSRAQGYVLHLLSTQPTEVDGIALQRDQELPVRPGSVVRLSRVMHLEFVSPSLAREAPLEETLYSATEKTLGAAAGRAGPIPAALAASPQETISPNQP